MKYCTKCGNPIEEGKNFCIKCGTAVVKNQGPRPNVDRPDQGPRPNVDRPDQRPRPNNNRPGQRPRPERDPRRERDILDMRQEIDIRKGRRKKKSKKPIIITCSIIAILVIAVATYLVIAFSMQSNVKAKCDELDGFIKQGVKFTPTNQSMYDKADDDKGSLNVIALNEDNNILEDLIKMAGVYVAADKTYKECKGSTDSLVAGLRKANIDEKTITGYNALLASQQKLKAAMDNNNTDEMVREQNNLYTNFTNFKDDVKTEEAKKAKSKSKAESLLSGWEGELKGYDNNAESSEVDGDVDVSLTRSNVVDLMEEYRGYLDSNDLNSANNIAGDIIKGLTEYKNTINNSIKEQKEEEEERAAFSDDDVEAKDDYYALYTIDTEPISGNPFDGSGLDEKQKFCLLVIAKNEVFATRGYVFGKTMSDYFKNREWYHPDKSVDDAKIYSELKKEDSIEFRNLKKIQKLIDKYAKKYDWAGKTVRKSKITTSDLEDAIQAYRG